MWAKNECSLHSSSGDTRAATRTSQPVANSTARLKEIPRPAPAVSQRRVTPAAYAAANTARLLTSIQNPARKGRGDDHDDEERTGAQTEEGHEPAAIRRRSPVSRG